MRKDTVVAIVGGGLSGGLLAIRLLELSGVCVVLIDRRATNGRGLAYSTASDRHLLNVRSGRMSLRSEAPGEFVDWARAKGEPLDPNGFARRRDYGSYIADALDKAERAAPGRLTRLQAEVADLTPGCDGVLLTMTDGAELRVGAAVLAVGNLPPAGLGCGLESLGSAYAPDPWAPGALDGIEASDELLLVGTGLTAVDVLLSLEERGWRGKAVALSRHGLLPRAHAPVYEPPREEGPPPEGSLSQQLNQVRRWARQRPWTEVMDRLRPHGQRFWLEADETKRARFLRHLRPWWDVHRHRMAPEIAEAVRRWRGEGRLSVVAGRLQSATLEGDSPRVTWRPRGQTEARALRPARVINCTGPQTNPAKADSPLLRNLFQAGALRADAFGLGVDADVHGRVLDAEGRPHERLYAIGPVAKGALWEVVAAPEIRVQALRIAERLHARVSSRGPVDDLFLRHPREVGETYAEHMGTAFSVGGQLLAAGAACFVHGLAPSLFTKTASRTIERLHQRITAGRRGATLRK